MRVWASLMDSHRFAPKIETLPLGAFFMYYRVRDRPAEWPEFKKLVQRAASADPLSTFDLDEILDDMCSADNRDPDELTVEEDADFLFRLGHYLLCTTLSLDSINEYRSYHLQEN